MGPLAALFHPQGPSPQDTAYPTNPFTPGCYPHPLPHSSPEHWGTDPHPHTGDVAPPNFQLQGDFFSSNQS